MAKRPKNRTKRRLSPWAVCRKKRAEAAAANSESVLYIPASCFALCICFCVTRGGRGERKIRLKAGNTRHSAEKRRKRLRGFRYIYSESMLSERYQSVFGMSPCVRSRTTSPAMISPATDGTNATDPGTLQREEPPCAATASPCPSSPSCIRGRRAFSSE